MYLILGYKVLSIQTLSCLEIKITLKAVTIQIQTDRGWWIDGLQENENLVAADCGFGGKIQIYDRRAESLAKTFENAC